VAEGVRVEYAEEVYQITPTRSGKGISLLCPMRKIMTRGDTLNMGTLSVVCCEQHPRPSWKR
jgi:alpha-D-xyloside xylohydrolase